MWVVKSVKERFFEDENSDGHFMSFSAMLKDF